MYHRVLHRAFHSLHGLNPAKQNLSALPDDDAVLPTSAFLEAEHSVDHFRRVLRVKAKKTLDWLSNPETASRLFLSVLTVAPMEFVMFRFMEWLKSDAYLKHNPPLAQMAFVGTSPAAEALRFIANQIKTGMLFPDQDGGGIALIDVAKSHLHCSYWRLQSTVQSSLAILASSIL